MKIDFKSPRKLSLPVNIVLFNLCRLWPFRDKRIWIFGALEGKKYDDNSRYFFEYIKKEHPEIRAVWMTKSSETVERLTSDGAEAYLNKSLKAKWLQLRSGVAFYTNGLMDFGVFPFIGGAEIVALWHGMGFKLIYNAKYRGLSLWAKKALDCLFSWTYRTTTIATSEFARQWIIRCFTLNPKEIHITGQPRNDAFRQIDRADFLEKLNLNAKKRIIIYMPTYRQPSLGGKAMEHIVADLYNSPAFGKALDETNSIFIAKLHPLTPHINLSNRENFIVLDYEMVEDNQKLLGSCDILVTDFSSCFIDFALTGRPILFYLPDKENFMKLSEGVDEHFYRICNLCKSETPEELAALLFNPSIETTQATNLLFEDDQIKGTCYCENVFKVLAGKVKLDN